MQRMRDKKAVKSSPPETKGSLVEALRLNKWVRRKLNILQDVSLVFNPGEFIVVVGQSGGGKTTLVDAIAGYRPATNGQVYVDGIDVYRNTASMRGKIGYVPQRDIIHMELTVYQALDYSAKLRLPKKTKRAERRQRIEEVLAELDLQNHKDMRISELSGGQQKRVSIGVELLTRPQLFFLDEPTSGLDPGNETMFMRLMRRLADQGRTVIMITHATKNVMIADKVLFMGRGGHMAWFGPPSEAMEYFAEYREDGTANNGPMEFDEIYAILDNPAYGNARDWGVKFSFSKAYSKYIEEPLLSRQQEMEEEKKKTRAQRFKAGRKQARLANKQARREQISALKQFFILSGRNLTILFRDRSSLILMLLIAPIVGSLDLMLAPLLGKDVLSFETGSAVNASVIFYLWSVYALLVGGLSQMREFVKEASIYKRERLVNIKIFPYVMSKIWVALILALYHALAFTIIRRFAFNLPGGFEVLSQIYITLLLATITGMMSGLMASVISNNQSTTPLIMILLTVPMYMFSGALAPVPDYMSVWATTRWSYQSLMGIAGIGSDVSRDACWYMPKELRDSMTLSDKEFYNCNCMGLDMFDKNNCDFPGIGDYYTPELDQEPPTNKASLPELPKEPEIPDPPGAPPDTSNQVQVVQYLTSLKQYQEDVQEIQDDYRESVDVYKALTVIYQNDIIDYQERLAEYTVARVTAVSSAEGLIDSVIERWRWSFVNKKNPAEYRMWLAQVWMAQVVLMVIYLIIILILMKRKDST